MAGYNLGTLLGQRGAFDRALAELRRALERDPGDADARWNYELLARRRDAAAPPPHPQPDAPQHTAPEPEPPRPNHEPGQGQPQGQPPPDPNGSQAPSPEMQPPPAPGVQQPMTHAQAERLLGSLGDLERLEQQNRREKKGKDW